MTQTPVVGLALRPSPEEQTYPYEDIDLEGHADVQDQLWSRWFIKCCANKKTSESV
jgi:hypothetical protein